MSSHRVFRAAFPALLACAWLPARLSARVVAASGGGAVKPVRLNIAARPSPLAGRQPVLPGPGTSAPALIAPLVRLHRIADKPKRPSNDPEDWEGSPDFDFIPLTRIQTGYADMAPRRKIGFLRMGESDIFEPTPWGPRRKVGFLRQGESDLFEPSP